MLIHSRSQGVVLLQTHRHAPLTPFCTCRYCGLLLPGGDWPRLIVALWKRLCCRKERLDRNNLTLALYENGPVLSVIGRCNGSFKWWHNRGHRQRKLIIVCPVEWGETKTLIFLDRNVEFLDFSPMFSWMKVKDKTLRPTKVVTLNQRAISGFWKSTVDWSCSPFFDQVITNLVKMVKARDIRRPFCPSGHWLSEEVNIRADKVKEWKPFLFIVVWCPWNLAIKGGKFFYWF